jgi:hypothetical protein
MDQHGMPPSKVFNQLVKGCEMAMSSTMLLVNENKKLYMKN